MKVSPSLYRLFEDDDDVAGKLILARSIVPQSDHDRELLKLLDEKISDEDLEEAEELAEEILDSELKRRAFVKIVSYFVLEREFEEAERVAKESKLYFTATEIFELAMSVKENGNVDTEEFANFIVSLPEPPVEGTPAN